MTVIQTAAQLQCRQQHVHYHTQIEWMDEMKISYYTIIAN